MKYSIIALALAAIASATPATTRRTAVMEKRAELCEGVSGTPFCCQTDVLGVADVSCEPVPSDIKSTDGFHHHCKHSGRTAECCLLGVASLGLVCDAA